MIIFLKRRKDELLRMSFEEVRIFIEYYRLSSICEEVTPPKIHHKLKISKVKNAFNTTNLPNRCGLAYSTLNVLRTLTLAHTGAKSSKTKPIL